MWTVNDARRGDMLGKPPPPVCKRRLCTYHGWTLPPGIPSPIWRSPLWKPKLVQGSAFSPSFFPNPDSYVSGDIGMIRLYLILTNALFQEGSFPTVWWLPRTPHRCWRCSLLWWYQYSLSRSQAVRHKPKSVGTALRSWLLSSPSSPPGSSQASSSTLPLNVSSKESLSLTWTWCWPLRLSVLWQIWCKMYISL